MLDPKPELKLKEYCQNTGQWPTRRSPRPCPRHCPCAYTKSVSRVLYSGFRVRPLTSRILSLGSYSGSSIGITCSGFTIGIQHSGSIIRFTSPSQVIRDSESGSISGIPDPTLTIRCPDPNLIYLGSTTILFRYSSMIFLGFFKT